MRPVLIVEDHPLVAERRESSWPGMVPMSAAKFARTPPKLLNDSMERDATGFESSWIWTSPAHTVSPLQGKFTNAGSRADAAS
jgi:hypothetical protein